MWSSFSSWRRNSPGALVHLNSERTLEPVRQDSSFAEKQQPRPARLVVVPSRRATPELGDARLRARRRSAPRVRELTVGAPELHGHQQCGHGLPPSVADVAFAEWTSGTSSTCGALQVASRRRKPSGEALATGRVSDATVDGVGAASSAFRLERTPLREARAYRAFDVTLAQNAQRKRRPLTMPVLAIGGAASWATASGKR